MAEHSRSYASSHNPSPYNASSPNSAPDQSPDQPSILTAEQRQLWTGIVTDLNENNILCHCRHCDREWVSSAPEPCGCGSSAVEWFSCWQFPDD